MNYEWFFLWISVALLWFYTVTAIRRLERRIEKRIDDVVYCLDVE